MMLEEKLIAAIEQHEAQAETYGNLSEERTQALDYYLGNPMGNEVAGRSQVISRQVWDVVEWLKPQLTDVFCGGDEVVLFSARGPEDVKASEQETDYVNYLVTQRNNWFEIWNAWSHDALIQKNGYVKAYWDDSEDEVVESYNDLTDDEFAALMMGVQGQELEVVEHEHEQELDELTGALVSEHSVKLKRKEGRNIVKVENLAPEFVLVDQNAKGLSLNDPSCAFVEHREYKTISQLRQDGFDVPDDIQDSGDGVGDWEEDLRDDYTPFRDHDNEGAGGDPSMRRVKVRECWVRVDFDEDGIAELRHVIVVGTTVLLNEDADFVPIAALCPSPLSHRHYGLSVADAVMDLQRIQTALLRGALDNQYLANNGRYAVNGDTVNLDDMLDSRPGGIVRVEGDPGASILPLNHSTNGSQVVPMMEYMDKIAQKRTGISDQMMGMNPNALNNQAGAAANQMMMTAAQQRVKHIARVFAETGMKSLFQIVHALTLKHSRQQTMVELRGEWVPIDPRQWTKRTDMKISVALGMGDKPQQLAFLNQVLQMQMGLMGAGLASPALVYNTVSRMTRVAGYKDTSEFWQNPAQMPPPPPQIPPEVQLQQMKMQGDAQKLQAQLQADIQKTQAQMTVEMEKVKIQADAKLQEIRANLELQAANDQRDAEREAMKAQMDAELQRVSEENKRLIAEMQAGIDKYKADLDSQTKIFIEQMRMSAAPQEESQPQPDGSNEMMAQVAQMAAATAQQLRDVAAQMNRPRQVVRDADGRIQGVI